MPDQQTKNYNRGSVTDSPNMHFCEMKQADLYTSSAAASVSTLQSWGILQPSGALAAIAGSRARHTSTCAMNSSLVEMRQHHCLRQLPLDSVNLNYTASGDWEPAFLHWVDVSGNQQGLLCSHHEIEAVESCIRHHFVASVRACTCLAHALFHGYHY